MPKHWPRIMDGSYYHVHPYTKKLNHNSCEATKSIVTTTCYKKFMFILKETKDE